MARPRPSAARATGSAAQMGSSPDRTRPPQKAQAARGQLLEVASALAVAVVVVASTAAGEAVVVAEVSA
jgi:hypothetical protein